MVLAVAAAALTAWARVRHSFVPPPPSSLLMLDTVGSVAYVAAGCIAWRRRPSSRVGPLLVGTGFVALLPMLQTVRPSVVAETAQWLGGLPPLLLAVLILSFPSGRLDAIGRTIVGLGAVLVLGFGFTFIYPHPWTGPALLIGAGLMLVVAGVGIGRWAQASGPMRRTLAAVPAVATYYVLQATMNAGTGLLITGDLAADGDVLGVGVASARLTLGWLLAAVQPLVPVAFLASLLRVRFARGGVGDLLLDIERDPSTAGLETAVGRALRDRSLRVGFWLPADGRFVGADGAPFRPPVEDASRAVTPVEHDGDLLAVLVHDRALEAEPEVVEAVCAAARLALARARLQAEVAAQLAEVRASRARLVDATDTARRRIERDLHDGAQQRLLGLSLALQVTERHARRGDGDVVGLLEAARTELRHALEELRELARGIHPAVLTEDGIGAAVESLAERCDLPVEVTVSLSERPSSAVEATAYFVVSEALANITKHASASRASVTVHSDGADLTVTVTDDGSGGADAARGTGLRGLRDRVEAVGGRLDIRSVPGAGTDVRVVMPCGS